MEISHMKFCVLCVWFPPDDFINLHEYYNGQYMVCVMNSINSESQNQPKQLFPTLESTYLSPKPWLSKGSQAIQVKLKLQWNFFQVWPTWISIVAIPSLASRHRELPLITLSNIFMKVWHRFSTFYLPIQQEEHK